jgi:hypothetical protein
MNLLSILAADHLLSDQNSALSRDALSESAVKVCFGFFSGCSAFTVLRLTQALTMIGPSGVLERLSVEIDGNMRGLVRSDALQSPLKSS